MEAGHLISIEASKHEKDVMYIILRASEATPSSPVFQRQMIGRLIGCPVTIKMKLWMVNEDIARWVAIHDNGIKINPVWFIHSDIRACTSECM